MFFSLRWDCAEAWAESYINTDVFLEPVKFFNDPFYAGKNNKLVLCESYCHDKSVASSLINFNYLNRFDLVLYILNYQFKMRINVTSY